MLLIEDWAEEEEPPRRAKAPKSQRGDDEGGSAAPRVDSAREQARADEAPRSVGRDRDLLRIDHRVVHPIEERVARLRGKVSISSEPGKGTTVEVMIPIAPPADLGLLESQLGAQL